MSEDQKFYPLISLNLEGARWYHWLWYADVFIGPVPILKPIFALLIAILVGVWT